MKPATAANAAAVRRRRFGLKDVIIEFLAFGSVGGAPKPGVPKNLLKNRTIPVIPHIRHEV
jgi:hypothetical protein